MIREESNIKQSIISFLLIIFFLFQSYFIVIPLEMLNIDYNNMNNIFKTIYLIISELIIILIIAYPFRKEIKTGINDFLENKEEYFKKYFKYWILLMVIMMLSNYGINILKGETSTSVNEQLIREEFFKNPIYIYISSVIFAPITEELIFRRCIRSFFKNNYIYIITSGLIFGAMHLLAGLESPIDYLYIIPYATPGFIFAYLYTKTNNILISTNMHIMHNGILMSIQTIMMLFL